MATLKQVLIVALEREIIQIAPVNPNLMEASRETKKRPGFIKVAVAEKIVDNYLRFGNNKEMGYLIHIDADELQKISDELDVHEKAAAIAEPTEERTCEDLEK